MKGYFYLSFLLFSLLACNSGNDTSASASENDEDDLSTAISFVQAALKGDFDKAGKFMLHDSVNDQQLDAVSRVRLPTDEKQGLWDASVNIHNRKLINDSTSIINYSNSFHKDNTDTLKIVKIGGKWLVDFKYLFDHDQQDAALTK